MIGILVGLIFVITWIPLAIISLSVSRNNNNQEDRKGNCIVSVPGVQHSDFVKQSECPVTEGKKLPRVIFVPAP